MCGIAGGQFESLTEMEAAHLVVLAKSTQARGRDGFGMFVRASPRHPSDKADTLRYADVDPSWAAVAQALRAFVGRRVTVLMSSRAQPLPEADAISSSRLQPYVGKRFALVHNGTISNDRELWEEMRAQPELGHAPLGEHPGIDTIVVAELIERHRSIPTDRLVGGYAFAYVDTVDGTLTLVKNVKTLWVSSGPRHTAFASEPWMLTDTFGGGPLQEPRLERLPQFTRWSPGGTPRKIQVKHWSSTPDLDEGKAVVVTSGGVDSITAAYVAAKIHGMEVTLVNVAHGQMAEQPEAYAVERIAEVEGWGYRTLDLKWLGALGNSPLTDPSLELPLGMQSAESTLCWTPGRNMVMVTACAAIAEAIGAKWLYYGNNMEEEATAYGDNDLDFVHLMNDALDYGTLKGVQIKRALARLMKPEILVVGNDLGVPYEWTWSCDRGMRVSEALLADPAYLHEQGFVDSSDVPTAPFIPCGECGCCTTRRYAFKRAGLEDEQVYARPLRDTYPWTEAKEYDVVSLKERLR